MSKTSKTTFPYQTTLMDSAKDAGIITGGIIGVAYILKMLKITPPIKLDAESLLKLYISTVVGAFLKDAMVYEKWIDE